MVEVSGADDDDVPVQASSRDAPAVQILELVPGSYSQRRSFWPELSLMTMLQVGLFNQKIYKK